MTVNIEIKGNLARLLATENLIVEHKKVDTASFDVERRVLVLPMWQASRHVYDMLVGHEVGHALYTPARNWKIEEEYSEVPMDYVNVVEDARIERLMKKKFAGLNKDFFNAYRELNDTDFFELRDEDYNAFSLIDKINLYFKIGTFLDLDFDDVENDIITDITKAETFEEVLQLSKKLFEIEKQRREEQKQQQQQQEEEYKAPDLKESGGGNSESDDGEEEVQGKGTPKTPDEMTDEELLEELSGGTSPSRGDIEQSSTQRSFDRNVEGLNDDEARELTYITIPELDLDKAIIPFDVVHRVCNEYYSHKDTEQAEIQSNNDNYNYYGHIADAIENSKQSFKDFKKSSNKDVNALVKEFEMKKSADGYARATTARTGSLDMTKLHTYKYNEDVFKKVTTIPDSKSHGLVFMLDWSGSMQYEMMNTIKQLYQLIWFCRKVQIPFEVYAFSDCAWQVGLDQDPDDFQNSTITKKGWVDGDFTFDKTFRLINLFTHTSKTREFDEQLLNIWRLVDSFQNYYIGHPSGLGLSGTPLNEAIIASGQVVKALTKRTGVQKCHCVFLTDGESNSPSYNRMRGESYFGESKQGQWCIPSNAIIRKGSQTFVSEGGHRTNFTTKLIEAVRADIPSSSYISFRLLQRGELRSMFNWYAHEAFESVDDMTNEVRKNGCVSFSTKAFDCWFGIPNNNLNANDELEVKEDAAKRDVAKAFRKMFKSKKQNKIITKKFVELVA